MDVERRAAFSLTCSEGVILCTFIYFDLRTNSGQLRRTTLAWISPFLVQRFIETRFDWLCPVTHISAVIGPLVVLRNRFSVPATT